MIKINSIIKYLSAFLVFISCYTSAQTAALEASLSLQDVSGIKIPYQNGMPLPTFEKQSGRQILDLAGEWKKIRFVTNDNLTLAKRDAAGITALETEAAGKQLSTFNDAGWDKKTLPGVENALTEATAPGGLFPEIYNDGIWYRKTFTLDAANNGKFIKLMFYAVNYVCDIWINDKYVGYHEGGYTPFAFDVSSFLKYGSSNVIAIRVDNIAWGSRKDIIPYNQVDWFNYAGVIHDIYLEVSDPVSVTRTNIISKDVDGNIEATIILNNKKSSSVNISATVKVYEAAVTISNIQSEYAKDLIGSEAVITGTNQKSVNVNSSSVSVWKANLKIANPKLWSMKTPNLYIMKVTLMDGSTILDEYYTQFGIRTVSTKDGKFLLNNKIMLLTGVARHEEHPDYGRSVPKSIIYSDLVTIKNLNAVYLRTAHYPNHLYTYLMADRLGIAIMEEIPLWQWDTQDVCDIQNLNRKIHQQMFREMVFKDYNRPSVVMWSTSNECHLNGGGRLVYHNLIKDDLRSNYDDGRLLTQSAAADNPGATDISQTMLDVAGWTIYFGIFYGKSGSYLGPTFSFVNDAKAAFPTKPIMDTEFGYWSSENGSTEGEQVNVLNQTFNAFKFNFPYDASGILSPDGNLMGTTWWCVFDWYQYKPKKSGWQTMGLISMDRKTEKQAAGVLRNLYLPYSTKDGISVGINEESGIIPSQFGLDQNYPNPFNPETQINYYLPQSENVSLKIYDLLGKEVAILVNEFKQAGKYSVNFSAQSSRLTSGVYFYKLVAGKFSEVRKMILIK